MTEDINKLADRSHLLTEQRLAESMKLDAMNIPESVALMLAQDGWLRTITKTASRTEGGPRSSTPTKGIRTTTKLVPRIKLEKTAQGTAFPITADP